MKVKMTFVVPVWFALILGWVPLTAVRAESFDSSSPQAESAIEERSPRFRRESPLNAAIDLQYVPIQYPNYRWKNGQTIAKTGNGFHLGLEWLPFSNLFGKVALGFGAGIYTIGKVTFPTQVASLTTIPAESYLAYHFDFFHSQILVPFAKTGISAAVGRQFSQDPWLSYFGFDYAAGLTLNLNVLDPSTANDFDSSMGVNATYVSVEYLRSQPLTQKNAIDLSHEEIRVGLRLEM